MVIWINFGFRRISQSYPFFSMFYVAVEALLLTTSDNSVQKPIIVVARL